MPQQDVYTKSDASAFERIPFQYRIVLTLNKNFTRKFVYHILFLTFKHQYRPVLPRENPKKRLIIAEPNFLFPKISPILGIVPIQIEDPTLVGRYCRLNAKSSDPTGIKTEAIVSAVISASKSISHC